MKLIIDVRVVPRPTTPTTRHKFGDVQSVYIRNICIGELIAKFPTDRRLPVYVFTTQLSNVDCCIKDSQFDSIIQFVEWLSSDIYRGGI